MHLRFHLKTLAILATCLAIPAAAIAQETDAGTASQYPWSGYWWAHADGGLTGPLSQYDKVFSTQAAGWEAANHPAASAQPWFGHCHAWSAAAVTEKEPEKPRDYKGTTFSVGDQKGLLCAVHAQDEANSWGDRYGDGRGSENSQDMLPDEVWRVCQMHIKQKGVPVIMDLSSDSEVWNYPVFDYEVTHAPVGGGWHEGTITLVFAEDDVHPEYVGTESNAYTYTFKAQFQGGSIVAGTSQWTGAAVNDHPDFAWYPYVARSENPYIDAGKVSQIVGFGVGGSNNPPTDDDDANVDDDNVVDDEDTGIGPPPEDQDDITPADRVDVSQILSPLEIVDTLANQTSHFKLDISVGMETEDGVKYADGGRYQIGQPIWISAKTEKDGFLYLFDIQPDGSLVLVFPRYGEPNYMEKDVLYEIPGEDGDPWFLAGNNGEHHLRGVVLTSPIALTGFQTQANKQGKIGKFEGKTPKKKNEHYRGLTTQHLRVPPPKQQIVQTKLKQYYTKSIEQTPPKKLKQFAQDDCLFFVFGKGGGQQQQDDGGKQQQQQDGGQTQQQDGGQQQQDQSDKKQQQSSPQ